MKMLNKINSRETSVTMFLVAMLLISSMTLREYAHFIDHIRQSAEQSETTQSGLDHEAKFHYVTEAELVFESPFRYQKLVGFIQPLSENNLSAEPRLLPETRAPPASV